MKPEIILVGGGGHCKAGIDVIEQEGKYSIAGIVDLREKKLEIVLGYKIIATDNDLPRLIKEYRNFLITVGQIKNPAKRIKLYKIIKKAGAFLPVVISPFSYVSKHAKIGEGTLVLHHALINAGAIIGANCIINSKALIEHDAVVGDHCHIATGGVVNGGVVIDEATFWGSCAVSLECTTVGSNSIIGCNATIKNNVRPNSIVT
ncbi:MAG: NeuD/PglB/VioB family sugar acetyltransferase [Thiotrichaceae bacterium]|nr:NeuD/PglB/VioB family sugar acetyltransferase [Thiotrichaceae bacterium]